MGRDRNVAPEWLSLGAWSCLLALVLTACSQSGGTTVGVVTGVDGTLVDVESFTVLAEGSEITFFTIDDQEYEFPLAHLGEHIRTGEPVVVGWELRDQTRYAISLTDG